MHNTIISHPFNSLYCFFSRSFMLYDSRVHYVWLFLINTSYYFLLSSELAAKIIDVSLQLFVATVAQHHSLVHPDDCLWFSFLTTVFFLFSRRPRTAGQSELMWFILSFPLLQSDLILWFLTCSFLTTYHPYCQREEGIIIIIKRENDDDYDNNV